MVHEIGHQLGLGIDNRYMNVERTQVDRPGSPIGPVPYPDDISGVATLYGTKMFTNIFASGQSWNATNSTVFNNHESDECVSAGGSFAVQVTVVNSGSTDATYDQKILLDDDADGASPVATFTWQGSTTLKQSFSSFPFTVSVAGIAPGTYYLFHKVDSSQRLSESREDDNWLAYTGKVRVDCDNTLAASLSAAILYL